MISQTLSLWGKGSVTLPKKWREKWKTKHFLAVENEQGNLVIRPILDVEVEYHEYKNGGARLHFPNGIDAGEFAFHIRQVNKKINKEQAKRKRKKR